MVLFHSFCSRYISSASSSNISSLDWLTATCTQDITAVPYDPCLCRKKNTEKLSNSSLVKCQISSIGKNHEFRREARYGADYSSCTWELGAVCHWGASVKKKQSDHHPYSNFWDVLGQFMIDLSHLMTPTHIWMPTQHFWILLVQGQLAETTLWLDFNSSWQIVPHSLHAVP